MEWSSILRGIMGIVILMAGAAALALGAIAEFAAPGAVALGMLGMALVPAGSLTVARGLGASFPP